VFPSPTTWGHLPVFLSLYMGMGPGPFTLEGFVEKKALFAKHQFKETLLKLYFKRNKFNKTRNADKLTIITKREQKLAIKHTLSLGICLKNHCTLFLSVSNTCPVKFDNQLE